MSGHAHLRRLLGATLLASSALLGADQTGKPVRSSKSPDVVLVHRSESLDVGHPSVAKLSSGRLVVAYCVRPVNAASSRGIGLVRSEDDGRTWSKPRVIVDTPGDDCDPAIIETRSGTLLLGIVVRDVSANRAPRALVSRSEDRGDTWSEPVGMAARVADIGDGRSRSATSQFTELANGNLLTPATGRSSLVEIDPSHVLAMFRSEAPDDVSLESHSFDDGASWTSPERVPMHGQDFSLLRLLGDRWPDGSVALAWSASTSDVTLGHPVLVQLRMPRTAWRSTEPYLVYTGVCSDEGSPSVAQLTDDLLFIVFHDACAGYVAGSYVRLGSVSGIDWVSPTSGTVKGGTTVTITGAGFLPGMRVMFGSVPALHVAVESPTTIRAVTRPHETAIVDIELRVGDELRSRLPSAFVYLDPKRPAASTGSDDVFQPLGRK